jgi:hypothetical protein
MTLPPDLVQELDKARMRGATPDRLAKHLERRGIPNAPELVERYANTPLPDGRKRAQVNPGDPKEWE